MHSEPAMDYSSQLDELIKNRLEQLTPNQIKLARHFLANQTDMAFKSAAKIAREVGVSEASVVRFSVALGFKGFSDLQNMLRESIIIRISPTQRLRAVEGCGALFCELDDIPRIFYKIRPLPKALVSEFDSNLLVF